MSILPVLMPGDFVELIAPSSRCSDSELANMKALFTSWGLNCLVSDAIFAKDRHTRDLLCANTDEIRFKNLNHALHHPETRAVICVRGGYGAMRLMTQLATVPPPATPKIFVGMSDATCLHLFLQKQWGWATIHGAAAPDRFSLESIAALKSILFAESESILFPKLKPLNSLAEQDMLINASVTGGNLALVQAGMGTPWQLDGREKIILLEEVGERAYRIDRMLTHLQQANLFHDAAAIVLGDFLGGNEPDGSSLIQPVLERFAQQCSVPVIRMEGVGHGENNLPIPCATPAQLQLGKQPQLRCWR